MPTAHEVPARLMIERLSKYLKENVDEITPPEWASIVKTGSHAERIPENEDWWYLRCASLLRKIYMKGPIGVERLRSFYGGRKNRGVRREKAVKGSGAIIRIALKQLEKVGYVETINKRGRVITPRGMKLLDQLASEINRELVKVVPQLSNY
ncbi:MAG: 30S ribosomal protein S19e [Candidatus Bathyarchaeia archaeon]